MKEADMRILRVRSLVVLLALTLVFGIFGVPTLLAEKVANWQLKVACVTSILSALVLFSGPLTKGKRFREPKYRGQIKRPDRTALSQVVDRINRPEDVQRHDLEAGFFS